VRLNTSGVGSRNSSVVRDSKKGVRLGTPPRSSLCGKNLANNGHSSYKCGSLAELRVASVADNFFLEGTSASESYFA